MASILAHAFAGWSLGYTSKQPKITLIALAACAALPDIDCLGFFLGIPYESPYGHRGFTHSILFALTLSLFVTISYFLKSRHKFTGKELGSTPYFLHFTLFFFATLSHTILDSMTNGGLGVAFFWPFDNTRYFLPWRPIQVSPLGINRFLSHRGLSILFNEMIWIVLPISTILLVRNLARRLKK